MTNYVILTGANGYLGSYVARELLQRGHGVIACKYPHYASVIISHELMEYVDIDITEPAEQQLALKEAISGKIVIALVNAAALLGSSDYEANFKVNAQGVVNMIDFCRLHGIRRFIQISSVVVLKKIKGPYGITKLKGQELLMESELDYSVFIPAMILGPESLGLNRVLKNVFRFPLLVPLIGTGKETQHPIYVKDFARVIVDSIGSEKAKRKVYEIAGDTVISFRSFIRLILKHYQKKRIFAFIPAFVAFMLGKFFQKVQKVPMFTAEHVKGILQDSNLDTSAIKADLGFEPAPLETALNESLDEIGTNWNYFLAARPEKTYIFDPGTNKFQLK
ncbi:MAG: NAD-dependent epimerase/dehydratase family protein [Bacteroidales bacterium]|nr:NAD-dependent epimerase/dehydratase family protein [Bacteroidales bacterium]